MADKKRRKITRQEWNPNLVLKLLSAAWMVLLGALKLVAGAVVTVLCIIVVCGFVLVGAVGD